MILSVIGRGLQAKSLGCVQASLKTTKTKQQQQQKQLILHRLNKQTTTFEEKGEPRQIRTEVSLLTSLTPYR